MFERLKTIFKGKDPAKSGKTLTILKPEAPTKVADKTKADKGKPAVGKSTAQVPAKTQQSPEERCGITPKMGKDEVREKLAILYKRYNRATSSLDTVLRAEAEEMLDAIVVIREKVFGPI